MAATVARADSAAQPLCGASAINTSACSVYGLRIDPACGIRLKRGLSLDVTRSGLRGRIVGYVDRTSTIKHLGGAC
jgi:hypothetical protein